MKIKNLIRLFTVLLYWCGTMPLTLQAQIELRPIFSNASLEQAPKTNGSLPQNWVDTKKKTAGSSESILLPFFDDFSYAGPYPDEKKWIGRDAFINNNYPLYPPTYGVATLDALDEKGRVYTNAIIGTSFSADTLLSMPIRLDSIFYPTAKALKVEDSVYLSFYYQPGGGIGNLWDARRRGNAPNVEDKLILEFYNEDLKMWVGMWSTEGLSLAQFCPYCDSAIPIEDKSYFKEVIVPIQTQGFNKKNFQFRFRSYSSVDKYLRSGGGQWHIDYVYLNYGRTMADTTLKDVAFVQVSPSVLKEYTTVPSRQFTSDMLRKQLEITMTNLSAETLSCRYQYGIYPEKDTNLLYAQPADGEANANIYPFIDYGYKTDPDLSKMEMGYNFPLVKQDFVSYRVRHILKSGIQNDFNSANDTLEFQQHFENEFAYDDGSSEAGIGLTYPNGIMAYRFKLEKADTLTAMRIFFNRSYDNYNNRAFHLCVWKAAEGDTLPALLIYRSPTTYPVFSDGVNRFVNYSLDTLLYLGAETFFVGLEQLTKDFLNVGFDQNNQAAEKLWYYYLNPKTNAWEWENSIYYGALMFRPAFGILAAVDNENLEVGPRAENKDLRCKIYPNPVRKREFTVVLPSGVDANFASLEIRDLLGRCVWKNVFQSQVQLNEITNGLYILTLKDTKKSKTYYAKILIKNDE